METQEKKSDNNNDCRAVSSFLLNQFVKPNGAFYEFNQFVKEHLDKLVVCFRGNETPNQITIYRNNHMVWKLYLTSDDQNGEPRVEVSFNHARYYKDWNELLITFGSLGFNIVDKNGSQLVPSVKGKGVGIGTIVASLPADVSKFDKDEFVKPCYDAVMKMMDSFFDIAFDSSKVTDWFRTYLNKDKKEYHLSKQNPKRSYIEKRWQQHLFNELKYAEDGLFVYDLEFSQPSGVINSDDDEISEEDESNANEPDMLAVRYEGGMPVAIVLVEVKSTYDACGSGNSNIKSHFKGMNEYCKNSVLVKNRHIEACKILEQYKDAGIYVKEGQILPDINNQLPIEIVFIFTSNEPVDCMESVKHKSDYIPYDCSKSAIYYLLTHRNEKGIKSNALKIEDLIDQEANVPCSLYYSGEYEAPNINEYSKKEKLISYAIPSNWK